MQTSAAHGSEIIADLALQSEFYRAVAEKYGTAFPPADPDTGDLMEMGIVACGDCGRHVEVESAHTACTDGASGTCGDCHDAACSDRSCRDGS